MDLPSSRSFREVIEIPENIRDLSIKADLADLIFEPHDEDTLILHGFILGGDPPKIDKTWNEDNIDIMVLRARTESRMYSVKMKVFIPMNIIKRSLSVSLDIGDVRIDGLPIEILKIDTSNGDILAGGVATKQVKLSSQNGDIIFRGGSFNEGYFTTVNGDIRLEILMDKGFKFYSSSKKGRIRISMPISVSTTIKAKALKGRVLVTPKNFIREYIKNDYEKYVFGNGEASIELETLDGDININLFSELPVKPT